MVIVVGAGAREAEGVGCGGGDGGGDGSGDGGDGSGDILRALGASPWCRQELRLPHGEHAYVSGAQHTAAAPQRPFAASALFVWQTTAAAEKWPATEAKAAEIRLAFAAPLHRRNRGGGGGDAEQLGKKRGLGGTSTAGKSGSEKKAKKTPEWEARVEKNRGARKEKAALGWMPCASKGRFCQPPEVKGEGRDIKGSKNSRGSLATRDSSGIGGVERAVLFLGALVAEGWT